jgi:7-cyano-7-deazaguanine synthase in queuosine biosynthesis
MDINIPFDKNWKNIAISLSGGADSALLAYLVCEMAKNSDSTPTIHIINHVRMWKTRPWQQDDADRVYQWLFQKFYHSTFKRHTNFIAPDIEYGNIGPNLTDEYGKRVSGDNIQQRAYAEFVCTKYNIDAYYNGVTRNPRLAAFNGMRERDIEPTEDNKHLAEMEHMGIWAIHPFRFVDKAVIVKKYLELGLMDLFSITRSCEGEFEGIDYKSYKKGQYVPVCNTCFWCKERAWALTTNEITQGKPV